MAKARRGLVGKQVVEIFIKCVCDTCGAKSNVFLESVLNLMVFGCVERGLSLALSVKLLSSEVQLMILATTDSEGSWAPTSLGMVPGTCHYNLTGYFVSTIRDRVGDWIGIFTKLKMASTIFKSIDQLALKVSLVAYNHDLTGMPPGQRLGLRRSGTTRKNFPSTRLRSWESGSECNRGDNDQDNDGDKGDGHAGGDQDSDGECDGHSISEDLEPYVMPNPGGGHYELVAAEEGQQTHDEIVDLEEAEPGVWLDSKTKEVYKPTKVEIYKVSKMSAADAQDLEAEDEDDDP
ncbi:hypothetical protein DV736_g3551, partial [Chaetothyriales sp. CBS 134916]